MSAAPNTVCPICRKAAGFGDPEFPFCTARCRLLDLGNWASEKYVMSSPLDEEDLLAFENEQHTLDA